MKIYREIKTSIEYQMVALLVIKYFFTSLLISIYKSFLPLPPSIHGVSKKINSKVAKFHAKDAEEKS